MSIEKPRILRPAVWLGNSKKNILEFPEEVGRQRSLRPMESKKMKIQFEESTGNVFADLGLKNSEGLQARAGKYSSPFEL